MVFWWQLFIYSSHYKADGTDCVTNYVEKNSNKGEKKVEYLTTFDLVSDLMKFLWLHLLVREPYCSVFSFLTVLLQDIGAIVKKINGNWQGVYGENDPKF